MKFGSMLAGLLLVAGACDTIAGPRRYSDEEIAYFEEIALGGFGFDAIHKWATNPVVYFDTLRTTSGDRGTVLDVLAELDDLLDAIQLTVSYAAAPTTGVRLEFLPGDSIEQLFPETFTPTATGMFNYRAVNGEIVRGRILIAIDRSSQVGRDHTIREELTQVLGFRSDSFSYPSSIFYENFSEVTEFSELDRQVVRMLYEERIRPGMLAPDALRILREMR